MDSDPTPVQAWTCCQIGAETTGAVHEGDCPYYAAAPRLSLVAALALPDDQWVAYRSRPELFGDPDSQTGRVIRWVDGGHDPDGDGGHVWGADRGPYAFCARPRCRLVYSRWDGGRCPDPDPSTDLVPVQLPDDVLSTALAEARDAIVAGRGVGLWTVVQQLRAGGYEDAADGITRELAERAVDAAKHDPELFAQLLGALQAAERNRDA